VTVAVATVALTAAFVAEATGGRLAAGSPDAVFAGVSIDSRTTAAGALFVAIQGDRFDGHAFVEAALSQGASGLMVSQPIEAPGTIATITVPDTLRALQDLAQNIRRRSRATVIAITGSAGKTSTKELTADLLATRYRVYRNKGNLNNHIGLPLSLTELSAGYDMAVVELGMNHAGEIRALVGIAEPDVRIWTNVGDAHIGFFGTRDAVAAAKAEILEASTASTLSVLNADDPLVMAAAGHAIGRVVTFGTASSATIRATAIHDRGFAGTTVDVISPAGPLRLTLSLPGRAQIMNVLAAIAVAQAYGIDTQAIEQTLAAAQPVARRGSLRPAPRGVTIIDDTYNASPAAMDLMLRTLAATPASGRRVAMLGEMKELGDAARDLHERCGQTAAESGIDLLVAVGGPAADGLAAGAISGGMAGSRIWRFEDSRAAAERAATLIEPGDVVLVKGSRSTRMDIVADALAAEGQH
jgi:UDP-N-acetylmuramoyl-tripeptide--D-alanyl-D-alanine ligase